MREIKAFNENVNMLRRGEKRETVENDQQPVKAAYKVGDDG